MILPGSLAKLRLRHVGRLLLPAFLALTACGTLPPAGNTTLCGQACGRQQIEADLVYWQKQHEVSTFYGWLTTLTDEQLGWIQRDLPEIAREYHSPESGLRHAMVTILHSDNHEELQAAGRQLDEYIRKDMIRGENYAFALLLQSGLADRMAWEQRWQRQDDELSDLQQELTQERSSRIRLEDQLEQLKKIEESLLGSNTR